ncbi:MAG: 2,3-bisphosphoglycerate-independent phosphoglycerate mutase [Polyangiaceae bacterium]
MRTPTRPRPLVLMILDGFGDRAETADNAIRLAKTPCMNELFAKYPHTLIGTSGPDVGLPPGQMGNSEVGHLNFGAGRIAMMDISRIDNAIYDGSLAKNRVIVDLLATAKKSGGRLHLLGLVSDGGVHSSLAHVFALIDLAGKNDVKVVVHAFLDGRDVQPGTAPGYLGKLQENLKSGARGAIATVAGRYWAMDRDNRWERVEKAFRAIEFGSAGANAAGGEAPRFATWQEGVEKSYANGKTDEFVEPFIVGDYAGVHANDVALHLNFRPDRARELTRALAFAGGDFTHFSREKAVFFAMYACMSTYDASFDLPVAFPKEKFADVFPEVIARAHLTQFRCAETEKYAHVTYFFNGGREQAFEGEDRKMVPSPKEVSTYDQKPEMSAAGVAEAVTLAIESAKYDFILMNFANPDMVGHTGVLPAAIRAVEAVDAGVGRIAGAVLARGGALMLTADHGNCELMKDPATGAPHTAHTLNPVPFLYVNANDAEATLRAHGRICDVAPTMLELLGIAQPPLMTWKSLFA